jgi:hypothetical protein
MRETSVRTYLSQSLVAQLCLRRSLGGGGIQCGPKPLADRNSDSSNSLHGVLRGWATDACSDTWVQCDATHGGEDSRDGGHHLRMLGNEIVQNLVHINLPEGRIRRRRSWVDIIAGERCDRNGMTGTGRTFVRSGRGGFGAGIGGWRRRAGGVGDGGAGGCREMHGG